MLSVLPELKCAAPLLTKRLPRHRFSVPAPPTVIDLTVCEPAVTSSTPPLTVTAELGESAAAPCH